MDTLSHWGTLRLLYSPPPPKKFKGVRTGDLPTMWPPTSPDLTMLYLLFGGYVKENHEVPNLKKYAKGNLECTAWYFPVW
jgi:hypothetical protein